MIEQEFAAGYVFFRSGDAADLAYQLHEGQVELLADDGETSTPIRLFEPEDVFGEMALLEERPRAFSARAVTAGRVSPLSRDEFEHLLTDDPTHTRKYLRALFERLRSATSHSGRHSELVQAGTAPSPIPAGETQRPENRELPIGGGMTSDWVVVVHPLTHKAAATLPEEGLLVTRFPLRLGRATEADEAEAFDLNDLWLLDEEPYNVSRNHCEILADHQGLIVSDRGSYHGCIVNDEPIGGLSATDYARLDPGENVLVVGSRMSKYQFRITVSVQAADAPGA